MIKPSKSSLIKHSLLGSAILLTACGGGELGSNIGKLSLNITDAPVDEASSVVVAFTGVSLKPATGSAIDIAFTDNNGNPATKTIDLLAQQGPNSEPLLLNQQLQTGHYEWVRLDVDMNNSYIILEQGGAQYPLDIPSGNETGLKLNRGFDISSGGTATFTIDFDLRKSVLEPNKAGDPYKLKPTLRIVDNSNVGHLSGTVGPISLADPTCASTTDYAVYLFEGDVVPDDVDGNTPDPISTALVSNANEYAIGFLDEGSYTVSFTCEATSDASDSDDAITFIGTDLITITAGYTTTYHFD